MSEPLRIPVGALLACAALAAAACSPSDDDSTFDGRDADDGTDADDDAAPDDGNGDADVLPDEAAPDAPDEATPDVPDDGVVEDGGPDETGPDDAAVEDVVAEEVGPEDTGPDVPPGGVTPYGGCIPGDPTAKLLAETAPPAEMVGHDAFVASVTLANCGSEIWTVGTWNLGAQSPQDNMVWGRNRVPLPGDVAPDQQVEIPFLVTAPDILGDFGYQWALVHEGVAWIPADMTPARTVRVIGRVETVELCPGVSAVLGGATSASAELQRCVDATPDGGTLELPAGVYRMTGPVSIGRPMTLHTAGAAGSTATCLLAGAPPCAVLMAAEDLDVDDGFFRILGTASGVTVEHLVLDGRRGTRLGSTAAAACAGGNNRKGFNATARGDGHRFAYNASVRVLCGTGMEWRGNDSTIVSNYFADNGDHPTLNMWSDGLTVHQADRSTIDGNVLWNNSDVALIVGGGAGSTVRNNQIFQTTQATFAGLMLDNFNAGTSGDFTGTDVSGNTIVCSTRLCDFAINLGPHPWYLSTNILGGEVHDNTAVNGKVCLNIDGAGTAAAPIAVWNNTLSGSPSSATFNCGSRSTSNYNIGPDSVVDHRGDATAFTTWEWHGCP